MRVLSLVVKMGDGDDSPLHFQSPYGPESPTPDERKNVKKNVPFPPVNAEAQEEIQIGHGTAIVLPSNGYRFHWEGENHALEHEEERTNTGENDEDVQESEEETNAQGNIGPLQPPTPAGRHGTMENNGQDNHGELEQEKKQREGKRCEVQAVLPRPSEDGEIKERGDGRTCLRVDISKTNIIQ